MSAATIRSSFLSIGTTIVETGHVEVWYEAFFSDSCFVPASGISMTDHVLPFFIDTSEVFLSIRILVSSVRSIVVLQIFYPL